MANQTTRLIRHTDLDGWNFGMIRYADSLCTQQITLLSTRNKHDTVVDSKGELSPTIHEGSYGQVCQSKQSSPLTHLSAIQMFRCHQHLSNSMFAVNFCQPATSIGRKAICSI